MKVLVSGTAVGESSKGSKKLSNHSARKTVVRKLKSAKIPGSSIIKVIGHTTTEQKGTRLVPYDTIQVAKMNFASFQMPYTLFFSYKKLV